MRHIVFTLILVPNLLLAEDLTGFERILLPAFTIEPIVGANAIFYTQLYVLGERSFRYYPSPGIIPGAPLIRTQPALDPFLSIFAGSRVSHGLILFVERNAVDDLTFSYELRSSATYTGTGNIAVLPVVRERDVLSGPARIAGVASGASVSQSNEFLGFERRNHLRIYDFDGSGHLSVRVRVRAIWPSTGTVISEQVVDVNQRDGGDVAYPFFGELLLPACVPDPPRQCGDARLTVELTPLTSARYYAMVSSTDNQSQEVAILTPERRP